MNRATLTALLSLSLLLTACPQPAPPPVNGELPSNSNAPASLSAVLGSSAGNALSTVYTTPFDGIWSLTDVPDWVSASPISGAGNVKITLTLKRNVAAPSRADAATLNGAMTLNWQAHSQRGGAAGSSKLNITANLYRLSGQIRREVTSALPILPTPALNVNLPNQALNASSLIVKYKTPAALRAAALALSGTSALQAQTAGPHGIGAQMIREQALSLSAQSGQMLVLNSGDVSATLSALKADPNVEYAVPNTVFRAQALSQSVLSRPVLGQSTPTLQVPYQPSDQYAPLQYAYRLSGYSAVWRDMQNTPYTTAVTVAVIDTGVRFDHPDLAGRLWKSGEGALDLSNDDYGPDTDPTDPGEAGSNGSHGTHVSGLIVASEGSFAAPCAGCSTTGVVGAALSAPIKVLPIRVIDHSGNANEADVALAVRYAAGEMIQISVTDPLSKKPSLISYTNPHPARVINLSLGAAIGAASAQPICDAIAAASAKGILVVAAAGNGGGSTPYYPAACAGAVSVASVRPSPQGLPLHAEYSQHYPQVSLAAYGGADSFNNPTYVMNLMLNGKAVPDSIFSTSWDYTKNQPSYEFESGTSQAAPQVSALAALLLSKGVVSSGAQALAQMQATATDLGTAGRDDYSGYGLINAAAALGAPVISNEFGLSLLGNFSTFAPTPDATGHFSAYLPDDTYQVLAGYDRSGNGLGGEISEPRSKMVVTLGPSQPSADVGTLTINSLP